MKTRKSFLLAFLVVLGFGLYVRDVRAQVFHQAGADWFQLITGSPSTCIINPSSTALVPCVANSVGNDITIQAGQGVGTAAAATLHLAGYAVGSTSGSTPQSAPQDRVRIGTHFGLVGQTTAPTITAACGTSPSIAAGGTDNAFQINVGTGGTATTCTVTWNQPYLVKPVCTVSDETSQAISVTAVPSTTTIVLTGTAAFTASSVLDVICSGN